MIDAESLLYQLMLRDKPTGVTLSENVDVESIDSFPFVSYSVGGFGQTSNGKGIWAAFLDLNVFDTENSFTVASDFYDLVHAWDDRNTGILAPYGWVQSVSDQSLFSQVDSPVIPGRTVTQYAGSFALLLRNN